MAATTGELKAVEVPAVAAVLAKQEQLLCFLELVLVLRLFRSGCCRRLLVVAAIVGL